MEAIRIKDASQLRKQEILPEVPGFVQIYLTAEKRKTKGEYFWIFVENGDELKDKEGKNCFNALHIEKNSGGRWFEVYSTGMLKYHTASIYEDNDWDLLMKRPMILKESEDELVYAFETGLGNVRVFRFREKRPTLIVNFSTRVYKAVEERLALASGVADDAEICRFYVAGFLNNHWEIASEVSGKEDYCLIFDNKGRKVKSGNKHRVRKAKIVVFLARLHKRKPSGLLVYFYRFAVWVKGKGVGLSDSHHLDPYPAEFVNLRFDGNILEKNSNSMKIDVEVRGEKGEWEKFHNLYVEWENAEF